MCSLPHVTSTVPPLPHAVHNSVSSGLFRKDSLLLSRTTTSRYNMDMDMDMDQAMSTHTRMAHWTCRSSHCRLMQRLSTPHRSGAAELKPFCVGHAARLMPHLSRSRQLQLGGHGMRNLGAQNMRFVSASIFRDQALDTACTACCAAACIFFFDDLCLFNTGARGTFVMRSLMSARTDSM